jgi:hypothetical protein
MAAAVSVLAARELRSRSVAVVEGRTVVASRRRRASNVRAGFLIDDDPRFLFCCLFYPFIEDI